MAITRAQQARQLYRDAGYVEKAYGKATEGAMTAPALDAQRSINMSGNFNNNLDKVANVVGTASDLNRYKTLIEGGGFKSMIPNPVTMGGIFLLNQLRKRNQDVPTLTDEDDNTLNFAEGGDVVGGEYDFDSARQMYGLGKLVKKITKSVKKVAKSPIGKAALLGVGAFGLPGGAFGMKGFLPADSFLRSGITNFFKPSTQTIRSMVPGLTNPRVYERAVASPFSQMFSNVVGNIPGGITGAITGASVLAGLLTPEQEEQAQTIADETGIDIAEIRADPDKYLARRFRAEGGSMDEPVAKKTMPLLDMDGQEMDLRAEGGFVPIGRMEKADDVPARLSKNEFVFTAEAVRNAGEGDVDKGAEVMYNMMKNLESGGDVSEESQGLEGAREMFQTSQRLEEVI